MRRVLVLLVATALTAASCGSTSVRPTPTPTATAAPTATPTASPSASPTAAPSVDHDVVYFARDRLPPVAAHVDGAGAGATAEARIVSRVNALFAADAPAGLFNTARISPARAASARIEDDLVIVDFAVPGGDWGTAGSAGTRAFIQQLIYTASEEPGIRRVLITENGQQAIIGGEGVVIDHPAAREDILGYTVRASTEALTWNAEPRPDVVPLVTTLTVDETPALARLVIDTGLRGSDAKASVGFTITVRPNDERTAPTLSKWAMTIALPGTSTKDDLLRMVGRTPVRAVRAATGAFGTTYELGLDDLRPWRVAMLYEPLRIVVDIGGDPDATSANIALYAPAFGQAVRAGDLLRGLVRAFEARFEYVIRDHRDAVVVDDFATASLGTSELWGTFELRLPVLPAGAASVEIRLRSPRDGSVSETVRTSFEARP